MLYFLIEFSDKISGFNVFRYITFRTGGAMFTAGAFVFLFGPWIIDHLRLRQGKASRSAPTARNPTSSPRRARPRWAG